MIVLDTNVLSEVMRASPERAVAVWMARENPRDLFTTAITEAEILLGVAMLPDSRRKNELDAAARRVIALFASRILPFESRAAQSFAQIVAARRRIGSPINDFDALIAAITHSQGMALATRNMEGIRRLWLIGLQTGYLTCCQDMGLAIGIFPLECPFDASDVLDLAFFPGDREFE